MGIDVSECVMGLKDHGGGVGLKNKTERCDFCSFIFRINELNDPAVRRFDDILERANRMKNC